jgi:hypothetical protein
MTPRIAALAKGAVLKKQMKGKKLELRRETLANLVKGGYLDEGTTVPIKDTVYSKSDCVPLSTRCESADTNCMACVA